MLSVTVAAAQGAPAIVHLDLDVELDFETRALRGVARLDVVNRGAVAVRRLPLQLGRGFTVSSVEGPAVEGFAQRRTAYPDWPEYEALAFVVTLSPPLSPGQRASLSVAYSGALVPYTDAGLGYVHDTIDHDFTLLRRDALAFPSLGEASLEALRRQPPAPFTFEASVVVPEEELSLAAAGPITVESTPDGRHRWRVASSRPVPFLFLAIGRYEVLAAEGLLIHHFPEDVAGARRLATEATAAREALTRWFGPLGPGRTTTIIEIPAGWGSQASLEGGIIQTADAFREGRSMPELFHELVHLWHPPDLDRPSSRWTEGLATFLQWRLAEEVLGGEGLDAVVGRLAAAVVQETRTGDPPMIEFGQSGLTGRSYRQGAVLFDLLYRVLGEAAFDEALGTFFEEHRASGATTDDFVDALGRSSKPAATRGVLADWLYTGDGIHRLSAGASLDDLVASYRSAAPR